MAYSSQTQQTIRKPYADECEHKWWVTSNRLTKQLVISCLDGCGFSTDDDELKLLVIEALEGLR